MNMILGAHYVFLLDRTKHVPSHPTPFTLPQCIFIKTYRSRHIKLYELVCFDTLYCTLPNQNKIPPSSTPFEFDCCTSIFILKSIFRYSKMKYVFFLISSFQQFLNWKFKTTCTLIISEVYCCCFPYDISCSLFDPRA